jgi:FKBP-type peptidyl-prolyl cis-trans isomerase FklB
MLKLFMISGLFMTVIPMVLGQMSDKDSLSYSLGTVIGSNLKGQGFEDINLKVFFQGIDEFMNGDTKWDDAKSMEIVNQYMAKKSAKENEGLKEAGEAFLAENAKKEGVLLLPSGLQYEILKQGDGRKPLSTEKVTCHYHGTLTDGTVFDSSVQRGAPATFPVNGVIQGWQQILPMMPMGSKYRVFIPQELAYGDRGAGDAIKPFSALIFEIELLGIE